MARHRRERLDVEDESVRDPLGPASDQPGVRLPPLGKLVAACKHFALDGHTFRYLRGDPDGGLWLETLDGSPVTDADKPVVVRAK